jgi:acetyl esterase/lipase
LSRRALRLGPALLLVAAAVASCGGGSGSSGAPPPPAPVLGSLSESGAGHRFYEIYDPVGPVRGTMLVLHGGGWRASRGDARRQMAPASLTLQSRGWRVVDASYSPGPRAGGGIDPRPTLRDVVAFYDQVRRAFPGPVCAYGESAGGHLAAMLAVERPSLRCLVLAAAPLDLRRMLRTSSPAGRAAVRATFGTRADVLDAWSPARLWGAAQRQVRLFATASTNDTVVDAGQLRAFDARFPRVDAGILPGAAAGAADAVPWMHSLVRKLPLEARFAAQGTWLQAVAPLRGAGAAPTDVGEDCGPGSADTGTSRWRLLLAGAAWKQASTPGAPIVATRGCSGSGRWQDDGLSLWAFPGGSVLPSSSEASLELRVAPGARHLTASFRGFLARPRDWAVGLYASRGATGIITEPVATCVRARCRGLGLIRGRTGALIADPGTSADPDARTSPPRRRFALPAGTRRVAWRLRCVAAAGCSLQGAVDGAGRSVRPRDPLGHPAIFSVYSVKVG